MKKPFRVIKGSSINFDSELKFTWSNNCQIASFNTRRDGFRIVLRKMIKANGGKSCH